MMMFGIFLVYMMLGNMLLVYSAYASGVIIGGITAQMIGIACLMLGLNDAKNRNKEVDI